MSRLGKRRLRLHRRHRSGSHRHRRRNAACHSPSRRTRLHTPPLPRRHSAPPHTFGLQRTLADTRPARARTRRLSTLHRLRSSARTPRSSCWMRSRRCIGRHRDARLVGTSSPRREPRRRTTNRSQRCASTSWFRTSYVGLSAALQKWFSCPRFSDGFARGRCAKERSRVAKEVVLDDAVCGYSPRRESGRRKEVVCVRGQSSWRGSERWGRSLVSLAGKWNLALGLCMVAVLWLGACRRGNPRVTYVAPPGRGSGDLYACTPPCSPGFGCNRGRCIPLCSETCQAGWGCVAPNRCEPLCNPPCIEGAHCGEDRRCHAGAARVMTREPSQEWRPAPPATSSEATP